MGDIIRKKKGGKDYGWYIRWTESGRRRERASHQPTYALARRMLVEIEARVARGEAGILEPLAGPRLTVAELCERFLVEFSNPQIKDLGKWRAKNQYILRRVLPLIGQTPIAELCGKQIARVRDTLSKKYAPGTVRNTLIPLGGVCTWAVKQGLLGTNPVQGVARPPPSAPRLDYLSAPEVRALLAEIERRARLPGPEGLAWGAKRIAIALAVHLGLRKGELFGLRWCDVDLEHQRLTVARSYATTPKSGKPRHVCLSSALLPLLFDWRDRCPATAQKLVCPVRLRGRFTMANHTGSDHGLPKLLRAAGCRSFSRPWHMLRHTFASHFVQSGGSLLALSQILGHSDVKVTMIYAHLSSDFLAVELDKLKF
jgi:integrase